MFILAILVAATLVVLFNWRSWLQPMVVLLEYGRNAIIYCGERPGEEETRLGVSISRRALKWGLLLRGSRNGDVVERLDLESGLGRQRQGELEYS
jgi:hypothetical protein